ncbi:cyanide hydratase [Cladophialophora psammophila CBS 110553]|uniref:Cyanide hydratase n=1 Tax=Cladophialophora psammophila CBS 110553 TaxID=1182543 RepID=W9X6V0_9EURO|nr:cyanide hydratase [Cladophialophora psammophila CBS 110553]EXJ66179.1 cyanide hydratase [Cladophialophora psammophila CBS 110553]
MPPTLTKYKAAVVVAEPGWFDLDLSVQKTIHWIKEASKSGCKLVAFPETWIPGYPYWLWKVNYLESLPLIKAYRENSLKVDSELMRSIRRAARENHIYVSLGFSEIDLATCYLAQVLIAPNGDVINHRRKIKPTHVEKLVFGDGTGDSFMSVSDTQIGRLGQLNCWENFSPFFKSLNAACGEQIHVAAWPLGPGEGSRKDPDPKTNTGDAWADQITPAYAMETCTWTLAPFQIISKEGAKKNTPPGVEVEANIDHYNGFSRIYAPDGTCVAKADKDFEGLLVADIDLNETHLPKAINDFGGAYMRSDLIRLLVDTRRKELVTETGPDGSILAYSTRERLGLHLPLDGSESKNEEAGLVSALKGV